MPVIAIHEESGLDLRLKTHGHIGGNRYFSIMFSTVVNSGTVDNRDVTIVTYFAMTLYSGT